MGKILLFAAFSVILLAPARAQQPPPAQNAPQETPAEAKRDPAIQPGTPAPSGATHRFFNRENKWLFTGIAATRTMDYVSTRNMRSRGRDEILLTNELVDNKPAFMAVEVGTLAVSVGLSYWMHRTGHHKIERWISIVHISVGGFGVVRNFSLKSAPTQPPGAP